MGRCPVVSAAPAPPGLHPETATPRSVTPFTPRRGVVAPTLSRVANDPAEDAEVIVLHTPAGGLTAEDPEKLGAEGREEARKAAAKRKAIELHRVEGANKRVSLWPRSMTKGLAVAGTNRMLAEIVMGEVEPRSAEEAARVAKVLDEIARREAGEPIEGSAASTTGDRSEKEARVAILAARAQERMLDAAGQPDHVIGGYVDGEDYTDLSGVTLDDGDRLYAPPEDTDLPEA